MQLMHFGYYSWISVSAFSFDSAGPDLRLEGKFADSHDVSGRQVPGRSGDLHLGRTRDPSSAPLKPTPAPSASLPPSASARPPGSAPC